MGRRIDPSWGGPIYRFSQCSTTGVTKAVVCVILSVHIKEPLLLIEKSSPCGGSGFPLSLFSEWSFNYGSVSNIILERLKDQYLQLWRDNIYHSGKGTDYRIFKEIIKLFLVSASAPRLV